MHSGRKRYESKGERNREERNGRQKGKGGKNEREKQMYP
jgi:hypothetical protein